MSLLEIFCYLSRYLRHSLFPVPFQRDSSVGCKINSMCSLLWKMWHSLVFRWQFSNWIIQHGGWHTRTARGWNYQISSRSRIQRSLELLRIQLGAIGWWRSSERKMWFLFNVPVGIVKFCWGFSKFFFSYLLWDLCGWTAANHVFEIWGFG